MFHPLYNKNGSFSIFRASCLLVMSLCMVAYSALLFLSDKSAQNISSASESGVLQKEQADFVHKEDLTFERIRDLAFSELSENADFMSNCGTMNRGFVGCAIEISDELSTYYDALAEIAEDSFLITLKAKGSQLDADKSCSLINYSPETGLVVLDENGQENTSCLPGEEKAPILAKIGITRYTDNASVASAPSGRKPLVTESAAVVSDNTQKNL